MAVLQEQMSQSSFRLGSLHLFGRSPAHCDTVLTGTDAAEIHASIRWNGTFWELVDQSSPCTLVDGKQLSPNTKVELVVGQTICFAASAAQSFLVINLDAPCAVLLPIGHDGGRIVLGTCGLPKVLLPDEHDPQASIHLAINGQWIWEDIDGSTVLRDGDWCKVAGRVWQFFNKMTLSDATNVRNGPGTWPVDAHFDFVVSPNEEHVQLAITVQERKIHLAERSHHYCLLLLARHRLQDARQGFDAFSQGWVGTGRFACMLGVTENHLSMLLHRARQQIARECTGAPLWAHCIERRRGEVRFGSFRFQILRGYEVEATFNPE